jgi:glycine/D-amino acid oxidase-like deaminating enzyme
VSDGVVETAQGRVRAKEIVVAVNAAAAGWKPLRRRLTVFGSYVVLTEPVPELLEQIDWTGGEAVLDGRMFLHYFRTTNDGRVLMGSGSGPIGFGGKVDARFTDDRPTIARAERGLRRLLPGLDDAKVTHAWGGPIDVSPTHLPAIVTLQGGRAWAAFGYTGNGVGPSHLAGRSLAALALGRTEAAARWAWIDPPPKRVPPEPLRAAGATVIRAAVARKEAVEEEGGRPDPLTRGLAAVPSIIGLHIVR